MSNTSSKPFAPGASDNMGTFILDAKSLLQRNKELELALHGCLNELSAHKESPVPDVDWLSNVIREANGNNVLGAGLLAEKIVAAMMARRLDVARSEADRLSKIEAELFELKVERANKLADIERIFEWLDNPRRKHAIHAFTDGPERQIAYRFEKLMLGEKICPDCGLRHGNNNPLAPVF